MGQKYSRSKLAHYVVDSTKSQADVAREVAVFLTESGRTNDLDAIMRDVTELSAIQNGVVELTATSAFPISASTTADIEACARQVYPGAKKVIIHEVQDKSVVGGVRLSFANAALDMTIRSKLNKLREAVS